jgi:hypothetical protein
MPSSFAQDQLNIYKRFREAAEGLVVEFGDDKKTTLLSKQEETLDETIDDVDALHEEGVFEEIDHRTTDMLAAIAICDVATFTTIDKARSDGRNFND